MRLDDLADKFRMPKEYYERAVKSIPNLKNMRRVVSSSNPRSEKTLLEFARDFDFEIYEGNREETLKFGSRFTNKVLSHGTFSWFIGAMGCRNNIIYPEFGSSYWHDPSLFNIPNWTRLSYHN